MTAWAEPVDVLPPFATRNGTGPRQARPFGIEDPI